MMKNRNGLFTNNRRNVNININKNVNEAVESITLTLTHYNRIMRANERMCEERDEAYDKAVKLASENQKMNKREDLLLNRISELIDFSIEKTLDDINWAISDIRETSLEDILDENAYFKSYYDSIKKVKIDVDRFKMAIEDRRNEYIKKAESLAKSFKKLEAGE